MSQESEEVDLGRYKDRMVTIHVWTDDEDITSKGVTLKHEGEGSVEDLVLVEISGRITAVTPNSDAIIFKPRSQRTPKLLDGEYITHIELAASATLRPVGQKSLRPLNATNARRHLADFHGVTLSELNKISDEHALKLHSEMDHEDLGHNHNLASDGSNSKASSDTATTRASILARIAAA